MWLHYLLHTRMLTGKKTPSNKYKYRHFRSSRPELFCKKGAHTNETLALVFSCVFCKNSKNNFFHRTPLKAASDIWIVDTSNELFIRGFEKQNFPKKYSCYWLTLVFIIGSFCAPQSICINVGFRS